jgi:hypothetical protein
MIETIHRRASVRILVALAVLCLPLAAQGATINIILSDMDVNYLGSADEGAGALFDAVGGYAGGNLDENQADRIKTAVFERDGNIVGTLMDDAGAADDLHSDLRVDAVGASIPLNVFQPSLGNNGGNFGFDFFTEGAGNSLQLGITNVSLLISPGVFFFTGQATLKSQDLPFGLAFDTSKPIYFSYTATAPGVNGVSPTSMAIGSGAFTISGELIPEPATIGLLALGLTALVAGAIRRRSAVS